MNNPVPPEQFQLISDTFSSSENAEKNSKISKNTQITVSRLRYILTVAIMISIIFLLLGAILGIFLKEKTDKEVKNNRTKKSENSEKTEVCYTKECMGLVAMLKNSQNLSIDPCDDFYNHVCGRFHEHQPIIAPSGILDFKILQTHVSTIVRTTSSFSTKPKEQLRIFAEACNNEKSVTGENFEILLEDIQKRGSCPMVDKDWNEEKWDFSESLSNYLQMNRIKMGFLSIEPYRKRNASGIQNKLFISPGPHWSVFRPMALKNYKNGVKWVLKHLLSLKNETLNLESYNKEFEKSVDLEEELIELAEYSAVDYYSSDPDNIRTLSELFTEIPEIDWMKILRKVPNSNISQENMDLFLSKVDVYGGNYFFGKDKKLINLITSTPNKTLANYLVFRYLLEVSVLFFDLEQPGQKKPPNGIERAMFCSEQLLDHFPMPAMNIFIKSTNFKMENLKIAEHVFNNLKQEYKAIFEESDYLGAELKQKLKKKVDSILANFGYQEYFEKKGKNESDGHLEKMYETLNLLESDSMLQCFMKIWRHHSEQIIEHIVHNTVLNPVHTRTFRHHGAYTPFINHFAITLPYLSYPFLDPFYPANTIYGSLSTMIGHEIGHGFDHFHRNFDWMGRKNNWWTDGINMEYERREKCLRDQYSGYQHPGFDFFMNGTVTRLELTGDHLGLSTAFRAFSKAQKLDKYRLPGMEEFSKSQMFFYNYAQTKCEVPNPDQPTWAWRVHSHPIDRFRVNGVLQNMPEFAEAFKCSKETNMNPEHKCRLF